MQFLISSVFYRTMIKKVFDIIYKYVNTQGDLVLIDIVKID